MDVSDVDEATYRRHYRGGEFIFTEGEGGDYAYVIESGSVEVFSSGRAGDRAIAIRGPGDVVGEMALIDGKPRSASARAVNDTDLVVIGSAQLDGYLRQSNPVVRMLLSVAIQRIRQTLDGSEQIESSAVVIAAPEEHSQALDHLKLTQSLREALAHGQLELHFQPIMTAVDSGLYGFESLLRWHHPEDGLIVARHFIGAAEESGLIAPIGVWVFDEVCRVLRRFQQRLEATVAGDLVLNVNLTSKDFDDPTLLTSLGASLSNHRIDPTRITLEVTESVVMSDTARALETLSACRAMGMSIAIDDFGTGYSSLAYLHRLPIDILKIDQSFIKQSPGGSSDQIVRAIVALAQELELRVVVEGVERDEQLAWLREIGCDFTQGYLHSMPLPFEQACVFAAGLRDLDRQ